MTLSPVLNTLSLHDALPIYVDDKIIATANELDEDMSVVTNRFIDAYLEDVKALGVKEATHHPRVTETMEEIIDFVKGLIDKGVAYEVEGRSEEHTSELQSRGHL